MSQKESCPYSAPKTFSASDLTYNDYLKVEELLKLQVPQSTPPHHDEMLFIVIHQAYELWFKLILHELDQAAECMQKAEVLQTRHFIQRSVEILKLLVQQIHILETMRPADFLEFRDRLNPASGFQSLQFREVEFLAGMKDERYLDYFKNRPEVLGSLKKRLEAPSLPEAYHKLLAKQGFATKNNEQVLQSLKTIYQNPQEHLPIYLLSESLLEFDEYLGFWREHHVRVVERIIGFKRGTGGSSGVGYLQSTTTKKAFPLLWEVRTLLEKGQHS